MRGFIYEYPLRIFRFSVRAIPLFTVADTPRRALAPVLIAEAVNASHRPSATDNVLDAYQLRS